MTRLRRTLESLVLLAWGGAVVAGAATRPNVLFILPDQYRPDIIGAYGGTDIATPNLDRLAREGMVFTHALSTTPLCTPYRGMLMTGRYPTHSGLVMNFLDASPEQNPHTLASVFAGAGYRTGFIGKWHLASGFLGHLDSIPQDSAIHADLREAARSNAAGVMSPEQAAAYRRAYQELRKSYPDAEFVPPGPQRLGFEKWAAYNFHVTFNDFWYYADEPRKIETGRYETDVEVDLAIEFMKDPEQRERPFLLVVAPHPPHPPLTAASAPAGYLEQIPETQKLTWSPNVPEDHPRRTDPVQARSYLAMAKNVDDNVGRLLRFLDESGLARDTIVVFSTDHGEMHGSHGRIDKMVPYREAVSIPLIVRWPSRIPAGARTSVLQTPMDHLPTLARLAGIEPPDEVDGLDLSPVALGTGTVDRDAVLLASYTSHWDFFQTQTVWPEWRGVETPRFTYARWLSGSEELYDNARDPYQLRNLAADPASGEELARLRQELDRLLAEAHDEFLPGNAYAGWYDGERRLIRTGLGPVAQAAARAALAHHPSSASSAEPPVIPIGLDAYRQWERWPYQRIGARAYMRSTYDRLGGNHTADASHFLYQLADDFNVTLDVAGPGVLYFARYNHWHGSPWHYEVDGQDHIVQETSTADPKSPTEGSVFLPEELFPEPLAWTWSTTKGADLMWVPIPFEQSFRMAYSRTFYGTGYYIYHQFVEGAPLSRPIESWDARTPPDRDVLELIGRAGTDIAPVAGRNGVEEESGELRLAAGGTAAVWSSSRGPRMIRALELSLPAEHAVELSRARLRIRWDDRPDASIDAPLSLFYGVGVLYNRERREHLVKGFPIHIQYRGDRVHLRCYFPMPFFRSASIELEGIGRDVEGVRWSVRHAPFTDPANHVGYFHATYRDHPSPEMGQDLVLLDTTRTEGGGDWSGSFVGTSFIFSHDAILRTLEGDPRFFFDDSRSPQAYGTGTEEWAGGGDYWGGLNMTLPFAGHPVGAKSPEAALAPEDEIESAYRFLLADLMPFGKNAVIRLEHGGTNAAKEHYETVTYWYGLPAASLIETDEIDVGDPASESAHAYVSPEASEPYDLVSRYEWGVDTIQRVWGYDPPISGEGRELYPAHEENGRYTTGTSEFEVAIDPANLGVMLRRQLDYSFPSQRAEVYVAKKGGDDPEWQLAGTWYLAGSNTCVYSYPRDELGAAQHIPETSNRRFRDDEFLVPRRLTEGQSSIRVRVKFTPVSHLLFPEHRHPKRGTPMQFLAWSELRYTAYSFVLPDFEP